MMSNYLKIKNRAHMGAVFLSVQKKVYSRLSFIAYTSKSDAIRKFFSTPSL